MTTYNISFVPPSRKHANSLDSKKLTLPTTRNNYILEPIHRKNSKLKTNNQAPLTSATHRVRKTTVSEPKKNSVYSKILHTITTHSYSEKHELLTTMNAIQPTHHHRFNDHGMLGTTFHINQDAYSGSRRKKNPASLKKDSATRLVTHRLQTQKEPDSIPNGVRKSTIIKLKSKTLVTPQDRSDSRKKSPDKLEIPNKMTGHQCINRFKKNLTEFEKNELEEYQEVFYLGTRRLEPPLGNANYLDGEDGDIRLIQKDHISYRYQIKGVLGKGSFGKVYHVYDHKTKQQLALKVIKKNEKFTTQAKIQMQLLQYICENDPNRRANVVDVLSCFSFRGHMCITFQMLYINLYEFIKINNYSGFSLDLIRRLAIQILQTLLFLTRHRIIHCDLKPQNIMLKQESKSGIKVIDFGSSCFQNETLYTYIQSRFYRAPEIILGIPYTCAIDMWSFGCILIELYHGEPIFPGESEAEQIGLIFESIGAPSPEFLLRASRRKKFFDSDSVIPRMLYPENSKNRPKKGKTLEAFLKCKDKNFVNFVSRCLTWDPSLRMTPKQALVHEWVLNGLPEEIRHQHIQHMKKEIPDMFD